MDLGGGEVIGGSSSLSSMHMTSRGTGGPGADACTADVHTMLSCLDLTVYILYCKSVWTCLPPESLQNCDGTQEAQPSTSQISAKFLQRACGSPSPSGKPSS